MNKNSYLVFADDFTGANDTGVQIRRRGIPVNVVLSTEQIAGEESTGEHTLSGTSWVLDTESRFLPEEEAFSKIISLGEKIPFEKFFCVYKKVDSTLRGNIASEIKAVSEIYKPDLIIFAPAYPDLGRTAVKGIQYINGVPVSKSEAASDPKTPVITDELQKILSSAFDEKIIHFGLDLDKGSAPDFDKAQIFTFDAETNEDLRKIVKFVLAYAEENNKRVLWAGSAGLADAILSMDVPAPPVLAVIASLSSVSRRQVLYAEKQGASIVKLPMYLIFEKKIKPLDIASEAISLIKKGKNVILISSSVYDRDEFEKTERAASLAGINPEEISEITQDCIGTIFLMIMENLNPGTSSMGIAGLFLSGGDTAISCFKKAGAEGTKIIGEASPGIPLMELYGGKYEGLKIITKAGAFGAEDAVYFAIRKLMEVHSNS